MNYYGIGSYFTKVIYLLIQNLVYILRLTDPHCYQEGMERFCVLHRTVSQDSVVTSKCGLKITRENKEKDLDPPPTLSFISGKLLCQ